MQNRCVPFEMGGGFKVRQVGFRSALKMCLRAADSTASVAGGGLSRVPGAPSLGTWGKHSSLDKVLVLVGSQQRHHNFDKSWKPTLLPQTLSLA